MSICQFVHMAVKPAKDQRNRKVDKCGFDWHLLNYLSVNVIQYSFST